MQSVSDIKENTEPLDFNKILGKRIIRDIKKNKVIRRNIIR